MNKLTAEKCREMFLHLFEEKRQDGITLKEDLYLQALEIALPVLELQEMITDNAPLITDKPDLITDTYRQIENDDWIEWGGGHCPPVTGMVEVRWSDGSTDIGNARIWKWEHCKFMARLVAYRVIENGDAQQ